MNKYLSILSKAGRLNNLLIRRDFLEYVFKDFDDKYGDKYGLEFLLIKFFISIVAPYSIDTNFDELPKDLKEKLEKTWGKKIWEVQDNVNNKFTKKQMEKVLRSWLKKNYKKYYKNLKDQMEDLRKKICWINVSFWDAHFGRMPLIANVVEKSDRKKFKNDFWNNYIDFTRKMREQNLYTFNEFLSRCQKPITTLIYFENDEDKDEYIKFLKDETGVAILTLSKKMWEQAKNIVTQDVIGKSTFSSIMNDEVKNIFKNLVEKLKNFEFESASNEDALYKNAIVISRCREWWLQSSSNNNLRYIIFYFIDLSKLYQRKRQQKGLSIIAIGLTKGLNSNEHYFISNLMRRSIEQVIMMNVSRRMEIERENALSHALRSAVAAIMARNMSHNIGSHVLNYLSNPEELDNLWII